MDSTDLMNHMAPLPKTHELTLWKVAGMDGSFATFDAAAYAAKMHDKSLFDVYPERGGLTLA